jgi:hypothetical protein
MSKKTTCRAGWISIAFTFIISSLNAQFSFNVSGNQQGAKQGFQTSINYGTPTYKIGLGLDAAFGAYKREADFSQSKFAKNGEEIPNIPIFVINPNQALFYGAARSGNYSYHSVGGFINSNLVVLDFKHDNIPLQLTIGNQLGAQVISEDYHVVYKSEVKQTEQHNIGSRKYGSLFFTSSLGVNYKINKSISVFTAANVTFNKPLLNTDYDVDLHSPYAGNNYSISVGIKYDFNSRGSAYSCI